MRTIFTLAFMLFTVASFSQKVVIKEGKLNELKGVEVVNLEFTFENTTVGKMTEEDYIARKKGDSENGERWENAWHSDKTDKFEPGFIELFNKYSDNLKIRNDESAEYIMIVNTYFLEPGFNIGVKAKPSLISTTISIVEKNNRDNKIVVIETIKGKGMAVPDTGYRIRGAYAKTGKTLGKYFTKKIK